MSEKQVILITGVAGYWGSRVAKKILMLSENSIERSAQNESGSEEEAGLPMHVIGVDATPPKEEIKDLDFIQADIRNPLFVELLRSEKVQTIVHLALLENYRPNERAFDLNVIGTMKVLGAAAEAEVKKVILRSSTAVYGASPTNPAFIRESFPLNGSRANGFIRNLIEVEAFVNGFRRQVPEMVISVLRFANIIGPTVNSPLTRFLRMHPPLVLFGFDPLMQVIHEDDVVGAFTSALLNDFFDVYNIAAEGVLSIGKILGLVGRIPVPIIHPFAYWSTGLLRSVGGRPQNFYPIEPDYLRYSLVTDLKRMHEEMQFSPNYTAEESLREFAGHLRLKKYKPEHPDLVYDEERLRDTLERRRRQRDQSARVMMDEEQGNQP